MKKGSLTRKSGWRLAVLGLVLFLCTSLVSGFEFYCQNIDTYTDLANSYVFLASTNVRGDMILQIEERGEELAELCRRYTQAEKNEDHEELEKISQELENDPKMKEVFVYWINTQNFITSGGYANNDIRYYYVVIPTEEDLIYVWDSDLDSETSVYPLQHDEYAPGEKESLMKAFSGEWDDSLVISRDGKEILGTALSPIYDLDNNIVAVAALDVSITDIREGVLRLMFNIIIMFTLIMVITFYVYFSYMRRGIINPLIKLKKATVDVVSDVKSGRGSSFQVEVNTGDEIEELAHSFEEMDRNLHRYITENETILAEKERIEAELELATRIQADMLPRDFPPFPGHSEIDLYAVMDPAKEVGGDFYDFFLIDDDHVGLVMADVSGKGIPAALFMMMSKIMIRNYAMTIRQPARALEAVNEQICANNQEQMFVTVWLGILDIRTGKLTAANAGHENPVIRMPDGQFEEFKDRHGFVIGGMEGMHYHEYELQLPAGGELFLYTDGLTEANNSADELFGKERMLRALGETSGMAVHEILYHVRESVDSFVGEAPQFDDLTMMCVAYYGNEARNENAPAEETI